MIAVTAHPRGAVLPVRARPGAKANALIDEHDGAVRVAVTAAPEQGKANRAIIAVLAEALDLRRTRFELLAGAASRVKKFLVLGITAEDLLARVEGALEPTVFEPQDPDV